ncbi:hypothetical protein LX66_1924 [Chitinophaga japonensis]|uniref:Uncharacterized protein n=2 Tax=Chitinophaga japonensis TaxID=104662 RepID=A0A562T2Q4_CHIJA|nr:hypothetical protein LX66_1924 [Chitinophaga japonensis]
MHAYKARSEERVKREIAKLSNEHRALSKCAELPSTWLLFILKYLLFLAACSIQYFNSRTCFVHQNLYTMKPFIFQFKERPNGEPLDFSSIVYDKELNLNIDKLTGIPVVLSRMMATETGTKTHGENSDSDRDFTASMATMTGTFTKTEASDSDKDKSLSQYVAITETATRTYNEESDSDR